MFEHPHFDVYTPETLPLNQDLYLRDEVYMADYERSLADLENGKEWKPVGYVSFVAARRVTPRSVELSWFHDTVDRLHELSIVLPRDQIVCCVGSWRWDEKPTIFVKSKWLKQILLRSNCVFGLIDAIGVRGALKAGLSMNECLPALRSGLDGIASRFPQISFVSFADSVLLKSHWTAGYFRAGVKYSYDPEAFLYLFKEIRALFQESLGLKVYGVFTQGSNEYFNDSLLHISESKNHVCLNSLGSAFANLWAIDDTVRRAIRETRHPKHDLYLDESYFKSLRLDSGFREEGATRCDYPAATEGAPARYCCGSCDQILANLKPQFT